MVDLRSPLGQPSIMYMRTLCPRDVKELVHSPRSVNKNVDSLFKTSWPHLLLFLYHASPGDWDGSPQRPFFWGPPCTTIPISFSPCPGCSHPTKVHTPTAISFPILSSLTENSSNSKRKESWWRVEKNEKGASRMYKALAGPKEIYSGSHFLIWAISRNSRNSAANSSRGSLVCSASHICSQAPEGGDEPSPGGLRADGSSAPCGWLHRGNYDWWGCWEASLLRIISQDK